MYSNSAPSLRGLEKFEPPKRRIYRGTVINPHDDRTYDFYPDGGLAVNEHGTISGIGDFEKMRNELANDYEEVDITTHGERPVITPAFTDIHLHWVQYEVRGMFEQELLPWLREHIWPEEMKYADSDFADRKAQEFFNALAKCGTVFASIYSSIHGEAIRAAFRHAVGRVIIGNVIMTQNSPPELLQKASDALDLTAELAREFGGSYAVTPRFAPTCEAKDLTAAAEIARRNATWIQTHLSENEDEVRWVRDIFPEAASYTDVYWKAGLLSERTIMGHAIHLDDRELALLAATKTNIAHCPSSNEALRSGRMPLERVKQAMIPFALGSDIGAGPSLSMLHVMQAYCRLHPGITPVEALYRATLAGAEILKLRHIAGNLNNGKEANFVMLKNSGTKEPRTANAVLAEILAGTKEDLENAVQQTFLAGRRIYP